MAAMKVSAHVREVMKQLVEVQSMSEEDKIRAIDQLYQLFKAIQGGQAFFSAVDPKTSRATALVEAYCKVLKPSDILDDGPGPIAI